MSDRREFLRHAAVAGGAFALGLPSKLVVQQRPRPLNLLILGGTGLTGPHQVRYALSRGHTVTVFNRGRRNDVLPGGVTELIGDRNLHQMDALKGKDWDVVIDNPVTLPFWVKDAADVLVGHTKQYIFISTISVYETAGRTSIDESSPLVEYKKGDPLAVTTQDLMKDINNL